MLTGFPGNCLPRRDRESYPPRGEILREPFSVRDKQRLLVDASLTVIVRDFVAFGDFDPGVNDNLFLAVDGDDFGIAVRLRGVRNRLASHH